MADNVLGVLFSDIADAIRGKTGDTATMKPAEFPEKISGIETGSGGGNSNNDVWYVAGGDFKPTTKAWTVNHNIGVIPEIIIVYIGATPQANCLLFGVGFNENMMASFAEGNSNVPGFVCMLGSSGGTTTSLSFTPIEADGAYNSFSGSDLGVIRNATATKFTVGGGTSSFIHSGLLTGKTYYWKAYYKVAATE